MIECRLYKFTDGMVLAVGSSKLYLSGNEICLEERKHGPLVSVTYHNQTIFVDKEN